MVREKEILQKDSWYNAYHISTNRMVNVRFIGASDDGMRFEDREKRVYSNREFYFWKKTE
jgi:hypothetical protein